MRKKTDYTSNDAVALEHWNRRIRKKKKIKHLSYNDLYHLVGELSETVDTNNRK